MSETHHFGVDKLGRLYAWGEGYGKTPTFIKQDKNVIDVTKDYYLADDGKVRTLKEDTEIKLSLNEYDPSKDPVCVEEKVVQISGRNRPLTSFRRISEEYSVMEKTHLDS
ncbi:MAG: hypothetical protein K2H53_05445 [Clostridia bacterium]|nr:hypothetical protein [Clostridia bacterium]